MRKQLWIFAALSACTYIDQTPRAPVATTQLQSDFTSRNWIKSFAPARKIPWTHGLHRVGLVSDVQRGPSVLEVRFPEGGVGPLLSGAQWLSYLPRPATQMTLSYWVKFPKNFHWAEGGKLPGLIGGADQAANPLTDGVRPHGKNGWSARPLWRAQGQIVQSLYHVQQMSDFGDEYPWRVRGRDAQFTPGQWHHVQSTVTLNDPQKRNGRLQAWLDHEAALDVQGLQFRTTPQLKIDALFFSTFFSGEGPEARPLKNETVRFAEVKVVSWH